MKASAVGGATTTSAEKRGGRIALSSTVALIDAIGKAHSVRLGAYVLRAGSPLANALEAAGDRKADVVVRLGKPYRDAHGIAQADDAVVKELRSHGVDAVRLDEFDHEKAAVVDDRVYLDDRNWTRGGRDTVIVDSRPSDVWAVRSAFAGASPAPTPTFAVMKHDALRSERDLVVRTRRTSIDVESENLGPSEVSSALAAAARHERVRLIVAWREVAENPKEAPFLKKLQRAGLQVRVGPKKSAIGNEKFCIAGSRAWVGSANATWAGPGRGAFDWGLRTNARGIVHALQARFAEDWTCSRSLVA